MLARARPAAAAPLGPGDQAVVRADGDCLRLHDAPALAGATLTCLPEGTLVTVIADAGDADGYHWLRITGGGYTGYAVDAYLQAVAPTATPVPTAAPTPLPTPAPTATPVPVPGAPVALAAPPPGGLTLGLAGTSDPAALAAAQGFPVESVSLLDLATQRFLVYIPGAPAYVNSLTTATLHPSSVVTIKRQGTAVAGAPPAVAAPQPARGAANTLPTPLPGGLTQGVSGTNDPAALAAAQRFAVETISMLDVASQRWLVYIPGAPAVVNTLNTGSLALDAVVTIKSAGLGTTPGGATPTPVPTAPAGGTPVGGYQPAPPATATAVPGPAGNEAASGAAGTATTAAITYYYCAQGTNPAGIGDGGGFCGTTASGQPVQRGGASCAASLLGQRFTIDGDPDHLVYTCTDTGGAVTGNHRDIWFADSDRGYAWWLQVGPTATVRVVAA